MQEDIINKKFGSLLIVQKVESYKTKTKSGKIRSQSRFLALCDCGNTRIITRKILTLPIITCSKCSYNRRPQSLKRQDEYIRLYKLNINTANKRKLSFNLEFDEFKSIVTKDCYYCGDKPREIKWGKEPVLFANGIDRVNNNIGYETNNCVPCCPICNSSKLHFTQEKFFNMVEKIYNKHIKNKPNI